MQIKKIKLSKIPVLFAVCFVQIYRQFISPLFGGGKCRFYPTCSEYAIQAFHTYGFLLGLILSVRRIFRCGPWSEGGVDLLPTVEEIKSGKLFGKIFTTKG